MTCKCQPLNVNINLTKSLNEVRKVVSTDGPIYVEANIQTNCSDKRDYETTWQVSLACPPKTYFRSIPDRPSVGKALNLYLNKYVANAQLSKCYFYIRCLIKLEADPSIVLGSDYGYLHIAKPPLVPSLVGDARVTQGVTQTIILDASKSRDPLGGSAVRFRWFCRRENERFTLTTEPVDIPLGREKRHGGCFGFGPGRLSSNASVLLVNANKMQGNQTYIFDVVVSKEGRDANASNKVRVEIPFGISVR